MIRTLIITASILCALLVSRAALAQMCPASTEKPELARTWINLDKASELLKQPGKKIIIALGVEKIGKGTFRTMYYSDVYIAGPKGDKVKIFERAFYSEINRFYNGKIVSIRVGAENKVNTLLLSATGCTESPEEITRWQWFGKDGYLAVVDVKRPEAKDRLLTTPRQPVLLKVFDHQFKLVKSFDLQKYFQPIIGNVSDSFHPEGIIVSTNQTSYLFRMEGEPIEIKNPFTPLNNDQIFSSFHTSMYMSTSNYNYQGAIIYSPQITVFAVNRPVSVTIPAIGSSKLDAIFNDFVYKLPEDKYYTALGATRPPFLLGYTQDLSTAVFFNFKGDIYRFNLKTGKIAHSNIGPEYPKLVKFMFDNPIYDSVNDEIIIHNDGKLYKSVNGKFIEYNIDPLPIVDYCTLN